MSCSFHSTPGDRSGKTLSFAAPRALPRARRAIFGARRVLLAVALAATCGCQSGYVLKQGWRQMALLRRQVPLESPAVAGALSRAQRRNLAWIPRILHFAQEDMGLDPGHAYTTYLDTGDRPVSYVVTAALPLALEPYRWRFPFAGTVAYKGYFDPEDARREVERLEKLGLDVYVMGAQAFSTLGWFRDPVLSGMLEVSLPDLVDLLLHECVHRTVYFSSGFPDATAMNESLASHLAEEGTVRFLKSHEELHALREEYDLSKRAQEQRKLLLTRLKADLEELYSSRLPDSAKRRKKKELFAVATGAYHYLHPDAGAGSLPVSNAFLLAAGAYSKYLPKFRSLQESLGGEPEQLVKYLKRLPDDKNPVDTSMPPAKTNG